MPWFFRHVAAKPTTRGLFHSTASEPGTVPECANHTEKNTGILHLQRDLFRIGVSLSLSLLPVTDRWSLATDGLSGQKSPECHLSTESLH